MELIYLDLNNYLSWKKTKKFQLDSNYFFLKSKQKIQRKFTNSVLQIDLKIFQDTISNIIKHAENNSGHERIKGSG